MSKQQTQSYDETVKVTWANIPLVTLQQQEFILHTVKRCQTTLSTSASGTCLACDLTCFIY